MIVCVCRRISDREIFDLAITGLDFEQTCRTLSVAGQCGSCAPMARGICNRAHQAREAEACTPVLSEPVPVVAPDPARSPATTFTFPCWVPGLTPHVSL